MGYFGSIYQKLGDKQAMEIFIERKGDGESCMIYSKIYHFNKKRELSIETIANTVDMLNSSSASYKNLAYDIQIAYKLIYELSDLLGMSFVETFDKNENFLLIPRIESSDCCGNSELVSFYEKRLLENEDFVAELPPIMKQIHSVTTTEEQLKKAKVGSCCQIGYMQVFSAFSQVINKNEINQLWEDIVNIRTKCDILKLINRMNKYLAMLNKNYTEKFDLAKNVTNLLYHYKNKINNGNKVYVSYCSEVICFTCENEKDVKIKMPYTKSLMFSTLFGDWSGSGAEISTKEELKHFIGIFKYVPQNKKNYFIENYFKNFLKEVSDDNLYDGETFTINIGGGY